LFKVCDKASRFCLRPVRLRRTNRQDARTQGIRVDEVGEGKLTVHLDGRQQRPVAPLELRSAADVDEFELEPELVAEFADDLERARAEAAVSCVVDRDSRYG
jgi:hypothetical protein